ncbi:MAG TPA: pantetheine-phosphate adenylyltransferase [Candidatus Ornithomonoglobus intestinigallinarum]|uniref:Phosphopantetheine adenylyltransferase n=1 Tax=Candidatus Ornithomonoglobus intestinigallinarum TaxID=2840894 RepID=A0A9D1H3H9_9FIRM|nr:pantetheine-phosphate adenylyltransferase [Candidatus Ornithomonoglobus intestinigallinarum]
MERIAVYPGSFDPITNGHLDIIRRASRIYDKVIVGVLCNGGKNPVFTPEERVCMIRSVTSDIQNVEVDSFTGLLVEFVKAKNAAVIIKGLRTVADFEYEFQMALLNKALNPEYETMFMMTDTKYSYISSSMVKELAGFKGDLTGLVPASIINKIQEKYK